MRPEIVARGLYETEREELHELWKTSQDPKTSLPPWEELTEESKQVKVRIVQRLMSELSLAGFRIARKE